MLDTMKLDWVAQLVAVPSPANSTTDTDTHPISHDQAKKKSSYIQAMKLYYYIKFAYLRPLALHDHAF